MSNLNILTRSHGAIAAKKRAKKDQIKEIVFDDDARRYGALIITVTLLTLAQRIFDRIP
jgi:hypothetical protein